MAGYDQYQQLLSEISLRLNFFESAKKELNRYVAADFNVFSFIQPDENRLSQIVAALLDPAASHGQGERFLQAFLKLVADKMNGNGSDFFHNIGKLKAVYTEKITQYGLNPLRRLDIVLDFGDRAIAIENKPWAMDQSNQLNDYLAALDKQYNGRYLLLYLTREGIDPSPASIALSIWNDQVDKGKALLFSYQEDVKQWLEACRACCEAEKVRIFLADFLQYIKTM